MNPKKVRARKLPNFPHACNSRRISQSCPSRGSKLYNPNVTPFEGYPYLSRLSPKSFVPTHKTPNPKSSTPPKSILFLSRALEASSPWRAKGTGWACSFPGYYLLLFTVTIYENVDMFVQCCPLLLVYCYYV